MREIRPLSLLVWHAGFVLDRSENAVEKKIPDDELVGPLWGMIMTDDPHVTVVDVVKNIVDCSRSLGPTNPR